MNPFNLHSAWRLVCRLRARYSHVALLHSFTARSGSCYSPKYNADTPILAARAVHALHSSQRNSDVCRDVSLCFVARNIKAFIRHAGFRAAMRDVRSHVVFSNAFPLAGAKRFVRCNSGTTLVEFLTVFPVLMVLMIAIIEFTALQLARIKTDKTAFLVGNIITQLTLGEQRPLGQPAYFTVDNGEVQAVIDRVDGLLPTSTRGGAKVVVSGFTYADRIFNASTGPATAVNAPLLLWAKGRVFGVNPDDSASTVDVLGNNVGWTQAVQMRSISFRDTFTQNALTNYGMFRCNDNVVLVEVFYRYEPLLSVLRGVGFTTERTLVSRAFLMPRTGQIEAIAGDATFASPATTYQTTKQRGGFCF